MKIFLDSANLEELKLALPFIDGVTTNPSLLKSWEDGQKIVTLLGNKPVSLEVTEDDMVGQAKKLLKYGKNVVVKLPLTKEGLIACKTLTKEGVKTNVTLVFSVSQALLAARAGATYISPFLGRLDDYEKKSDAGFKLVSDIRQTFDRSGIKTQILGASIRHTDHITQCALAGADCVTVPFKVFNEMFQHPLTEAGIEKFAQDWKKSQG